jgi:hypothetical protein
MALLLFRGASRALCELVVEPLELAARLLEPTVQTVALACGSLAAARRMEPRDCGQCPKLRCRSIRNG